MIRPRHATVTAKLVEEKNVTASGIFLANASAKALAPKVAVILAVGPKVEGLKKGDKVVFKPYATYEVKEGEKELVMLEDEDILGVVE